VLLPKSLRDPAIEIGSERLSEQLDDVAKLNRSNRIAIVDLSEERGSPRDIRGRVCRGSLRLADVNAQYVRFR
jgi:hypothetical protein